MKMNRILLFTGLSLITIYLAGCGTEQTQPSEPVCLSGVQEGKVMTEAQDVLERMNFVIDKADAGHGYIRTQPLTGAQAFEFWRKDNVGRFNTSEANLQTIRRTVEINLYRRDDRVCADCVVMVERLSLPESGPAGGSRPSMLFGRTSTSLRHLDLTPRQKASLTWIELGRDSRLEEEILERLKARL
jgi:hypothetical protein